MLFMTFFPFSYSPGGRLVVVRERELVVRLEALELVEGGGLEVVVLLRELVLGGGLEVVVLLRELVLGGGREVVVLLRELVLGGGREVVVLLRELVLGGGREVVVLLRELVLGGGLEVVVRLRELVLGGGLEVVVLVRELDRGGGREVVVRDRELVVGGREELVRPLELEVDGRLTVVRPREEVVGSRVVVPVRLEVDRVSPLRVRELVRLSPDDEREPTLRPVYLLISSLPTARAVSRMRLVPRSVTGGVCRILPSATRRSGVLVVVVRSDARAGVRASPTPDRVRVASPERASPAFLVLVSLSARVRESRRASSSADATAVLLDPAPTARLESRRAVTPRRRSAGRRS